MDQSEPPNSWEKPWTPDDLRRNSNCWSLAGDAGLLKYLQEFTQNLVTRTCVTQKAVDELIEDLNRTSSSVNNATNAFLSLANIQFVENRVYEDDETKSITENDMNVEEQSQPTEEQDVEAVDVVHEALGISLGIIDTMFEAIDVPAVSDSEEEVEEEEEEQESSASTGRVVLQPVNPYASRPLPFLIGSREFYDDDRVGLTDLFHDEEESEMPGDAAVLSSASASDVEADYALPDRKKRRRMSSMSGSENSEPESEQLSGYIGHHHKQQRVGPPLPHMLGEDSSHEVASEQQLPPNMGQLPNSFAAELAARLGVAPDSIQQTTPQNSPAPQERPNDIGNMFLPPPDDDDLLFGKNSKYSNGGGLFDDWNSSNEPESLWDHPEVKKGHTNKERVPAEPTYKIAAEEDNPILGQSKADDLFSSDVEEDLFSTNITGKSKKLSGTASQTGSKKVLPTNSIKKVENKAEKPPAPLSESSGLFDDLWDTSDFDYNPPSSTVEINTNKEENLFTPASEKDLVKNNDVLDISNTQAAHVKKPIGGVSVLGNMNITASQLISRLHPSVKEPEDSDSHNKKATESVSNKSSSSTQSGSSNSPVIPTQQKKPQSLFDDDNESDEDNFLFSSASSTGSRSRKSVDTLSVEKKTDTPTQQTFKKTSVLESNSRPVAASSADIPSDDLFGMKTDNSILSTEDKKHSIFSQGNVLDGGLFDDWENDMYNASPKKGNNVSEQSNTPKNTTAESIDNVTSDQDSLSSLLLKKESSENDIFSLDVNEGSILAGSDPNDSLFGKVGSEVKPSISERQSSKLNLFSSDEFDEEVDIFDEQMKPDKSNFLRNNGAKLFPDKKTKSVVVAKSEPPDLLDDEVADIFSIPIEETVGKEVAKNRKTTEYRANDEFKTEVTPSNSKTNEVKKPVVPEKPVNSTSESALPNHSQQASSADMVTVTSLDLNVDSLPDISNEEYIPKNELEIPNEVEDSIQVLKKQKDKAVLPSKPEPPRTLDIRKTTALEEDDSTGDDLFGDGSPVVAEGLFNIHQEKKKPLSTAAFGELLKGYSPPEDTMDGLSFSRKKTPEEKKGQPDKDTKIFIKTDAQISARNLRPTLNIDPLALLPGAKPPKKTPQSEGAIGFDQPAADITATLHSAGKDRVKIQVKRRPQSRHARKEALRTSTVSVENDLEEAADTVPLPRAEQPSRSSEQSLDDNKKKAPDLQAEQTVLPYEKSSEANSTATGNSLLSPSTDEEDLFGVPSDLPSDYNDGNDLFKSAPVISPTETSSKPIISDVPLDYNDGDDLFKSAPAILPTETPSKPITSDVTLDYNDGNDLFESAPVISPTETSSKPTTSDLPLDHDDGDDLFKSDPVILPKEISSKPITSDLPLDYNDGDDLFKSFPAILPTETSSKPITSDVPFEYNDGNKLFKSAPALLPTETSSNPIASDTHSEDVSDPLDSLFSSNFVENRKATLREAVPQNASNRTSLPEISDTLGEIVQQTRPSTNNNDLFNASDDLVSSKTVFPTAYKEDTSVEEGEKGVEISKSNSLLQYSEDDLFPSAKSDKYPGGYQTDLFGKDDLMSKDDGLFSDSSWTTGGVGGVIDTPGKPVTEKLPGDNLSIQKDKGVGSKLHKENIVSNEKLSHERTSTSDENTAAKGVLALSDDGNEELFSTNAKTKQSQKPPKTNVKEKSAKNKASQNVNLFSDDSPETDDLFSSIPHVSDKKQSGSKSSNAAGNGKTDGTKKSASKGTKSLFDDEEEGDLFGKTSVTSSFHSSTKTTSSGSHTKDGLFSTKSGMPKTKQKSQGESSSRIKKESTVVFEDPLTALKDT